ncbi:MAG: hypothetical protein WD181_00570 [Solirubrobacterales bacterium]
MNEGEETDRDETSVENDGRSGFMPGRVHLSEVTVGIGGVVMLVGVLLGWSADEGAIAALSLLGLVVLLIGAAAVPVPLVAALSPRTNLPMAWETLLAGAVTLLAMALLIRTALTSAGGFGSGLLVVLAGTLLTLVAVWRSVAREF